VIDENGDIVSRDPIMDDDRSNYVCYVDKKKLKKAGKDPFRYEPPKEDE
jgi:hypothetical protein